MTDRSEKIVEAVARALVERDGWDFDNMPGRARAQYLGASKTALLAVLPMVAEEIAAAIEGEAKPPESMTNMLVNSGLADARKATGKVFSSLIEDLKT